MNCPICETELIVWRDILDGWCLCEEMADCPNKHYSYYFSYGYTTITVREKEFSWGYLTSEKEIKSINKVIEKDILKFKGQKNGTKMAGKL